MSRVASFDVVDVDLFRCSLRTWAARGHHRSAEDQSGREEMLSGWTPLPCRAVEPHPNALA